MTSPQSRLLILTVATVLVSLGMSSQFSTVAYGQSSGIPITGDYRYAIHDPEMPAEAKDHACREAMRLAVSTAPPVREHTASPVDSVMFRDVVETLLTQHVTDMQILEVSQKGGIVHCKVKGTLQAEVVPQVVHAQFKGNGPDTGILDRNRALQIVGVEDQDGTIVVTYKALRRLDWSTTAYVGSFQGMADVMVDFFDAAGILIKTHRHPARRTLAGDDVMNPGQVGVVKVPRPLQARTYRVWLVK
ncbi:MAG: hypothetical protein ABW047_07895 [Nitrospiraceae bacterium]